MTASEIRHSSRFLILPLNNSSPTNLARRHRRWRKRGKVQRLLNRNFQRAGIWFSIPQVSVTSKKEFKVHASFAAADEADFAYYRSLTGNEKLRIMLEIMAPAYEANPRFERVYRVIERSSRKCLIEKKLAASPPKTLPTRTP
jgi:hypothetical protein